MNRVLILADAIVSLTFTQFLIMVGGAMVWDLVRRWFASHGIDIDSKLDAYSAAADKIADSANKVLPKFKFTLEKGIDIAKLPNPSLNSTPQDTTSSDLTEELHEFEKEVGKYVSMVDPKLEHLQRSTDAIITHLGLDKDIGQNGTEKENVDGQT